MDATNTTAAEPGPGAAAQLAATSAVQLVQDAARERRGMHGKHAADLLDERGYRAEAALVRGEVRAQNGHLSAKQAAQFLLRAQEGDAQ